MIVRFAKFAPILIALTIGGCSGLWGNDEFQRYSQRTDTITMSAGDAKNVNMVTQMYHPWPPGVYDRQIVADGARTQRALARYRRGSTPNDPLPSTEAGAGKTFGRSEGLPQEPLPNRPSSEAAPGAAYGQ